MTITVTDVTEPGIVTLSSLQPQVDVDPADGHPRSTLKRITPPILPGSGSSPSEQEFGLGGDRRLPFYATRTPDDTDTIVGSYLRATATYKDADGTERTARCGVGQQSAGGACCHGRDRS